LNDDTTTGQELAGLAGPASLFLSPPEHFLEAFLEEPTVAGSNILSVSGILAAAGVFELGAGNLALKEASALFLDEHAGATTAFGARAPFADDLVLPREAYTEEVSVLGADVENIASLGGDDLDTLGDRHAVIDVDRLLHNAWEDLGGTSSQSGATDRFAAKAGQEIMPSLRQCPEGVGEVHDRLGGIDDGPVAIQNGIVQGTAANINPYVQTLIARPAICC
jgi:hypothetical protein